ncbi:MAG: thiazole biosynthesis adenylyltransferase ThiF [Candidatus Omnitrophica bacterium]|nr:thiazole biosynthesis adenylyltransferase ThiF [Candidatus Omnitrophota bacterium]
MREYSRHYRQRIVQEAGHEGQRRLSQACVAIVGLGPLGSMAAHMLSRAGIGTLRLIDRDSLRTNRAAADDIRPLTKLPKAVALQQALSRLSPGTRTEALVADVSALSAEDLLGGADLILDGTDNFETRFLLNDYALYKGKPWIFGFARRTEGMAYAVFPEDPPCLRCLFGCEPRRAETQICDPSGSLVSAAHRIASFQATEAVKILAGWGERVDRRIWKVDVWSRFFKSIAVSHLENLPCSGCSCEDYPYLFPETSEKRLALSGRNAVQICLVSELPIDFREMAERLSGQAEISFNPYLMNISVEPYEITVFRNGRAIIEGTEDPQRAMSLYQRFVAA